jgi:hypothetical protein
MGSSRFRPNHSTVVAYLALFIALGGGTTAVALSGTDTVQSDDLGPGAQVKAPDVDANAVNGADVLNGSLSLLDLSATSRPHKLEFTTLVEPEPPRTIATVGNLQVKGVCDPPLDLFIYLKNLTAQNGTMNALLTDQTASNGAVTVHTVGQPFDAGGEFTLDSVDPTEGLRLAGGNFNRVEGQVVFQTPGRVTTIDFHAITIGPSNTGQCEFFGTAVTSNLS